MKVVILCGGLGTRLREETEFRPKPMVPIGHKPILWHIIKLYSHHGFKEFVLALGYKHELMAAGGGTFTIGAGESFGRPHELYYTAGLHCP